MLTDISGVRLKLVGGTLNQYMEKAADCEDLGIIHDKWAPSFVS